MCDLVPGLMLYYDRLKTRRWDDGPADAYQDRQEEAGLSRFRQGSNPTEPTWSFLWGNLQINMAEIFNRGWDYELERL